MPSSARNPIYTLHLTDWHFQDADYLTNDARETENSKEESKKDASRLKKRIQKLEEIPNAQARYVTSIKEIGTKFLIEKGRKFFDLVIITGDMMDKNGSGNGHDLVAKEINNLKAIDESGVALIGEESKIYICAGNHDSDFSMTMNILSEMECTRALKMVTVPNSVIIDKHIAKFQEGFSAFKAFGEAIGATNKDNPFNGCDTIAFGDTEIMCSWFNSGWMSMSDKDWKNLPELDKEKPRTLYSDMNNLSVGYHINQEIFEKLGDFNRRKDEEKEAKSPKKFFSYALCHHNPRHFNWFDKYPTDKSLRMNTEVINSWKHELKCDDDGNFRRDECLYQHFKQYDLTVNGHTHGSFFDDSFMTSSGGRTMDSVASTNYLSILELDTIRELTTRYEYPVESGKEAPNPVVFVHNTKHFEKKIKSSYESHDLYEDLSSNGLLKTEFELPEPLKSADYSEHIVEMSGLDEKNGLISANSVNSIKSNPLIINDLEHELLAMAKIKC